MNSCVEYACIEQNAIVPMVFPHYYCSCNARNVQSYLMPTIGLLRFNGDFLRALECYRYPFPFDKTLQLCWKLPVWRTAVIGSLGQRPSLFMLMPGAKTLKRDSWLNFKSFIVLSVGFIFFCTKNSLECKWHKRLVSEFLFLHFEYCYRIWMGHQTGWQVERFLRERWL
jgi:hypothetical protein